LCDKSGLSAGAIVGIIVGIVVFVSLVVVVSVLFLRRHYFTGLRIPDMSKFMFFLPKRIDEDGDDSKSIEVIESLVDLDISNDFEWVTNVLYSTPVSFHFFDFDFCVLFDWTDLCFS
jgi:hypothetical protein